MRGYTSRMTAPKSDEQSGEQVGEEPKVEAPAVDSKPSKTLQELERLQFDALDRAGFDR
jgi:hypothetical protein